MSLTRLETLERTLSERETELADTLNRLELVPGERHQERTKSIRNAPTVSTLSRGTVARKLEDEEDNLHRRVKSLNEEIQALVETVTVERRKKALEDLAVPIAEGEALREQERSLWQEAGELYAPLIAVVNKLHAVAQERDQLLLRNEHVLRDCEDPGLKARGEAAFSQVVAPFPVDVPEALDYLLRATVDPHGMGYREFAARIDHNNVLVSLTPDLRGMNSVASLSGRAEKVRSVREARQPLTVLPA